MAKKRKNRTKPANSARKSSTPAARRADLRTARQRQQRLRTLAYAAVAVILMGLIVFLVARRALNRPGERVADMGNTHITADQADSVSYNSLPPTSGPHYGQLAAWGIHDDPVADGFAIHNLEDGGVGIWYDCPEGCPDLVAQLAGLVEEVGEEGLLLAPYPGLDTTIALTAWNRIDTFDKFDEERIKAFVDAYRGIDHHR